MQSTFLKDIFRHKQTIQGCRESSVDGHLNDDLQNFLLGRSHIQGAMDMDLELRCGIAHRRESSHDREFACLQIKTRPAVHITDRKFDQIGSKVWCEISETLDNTFTLF